MTRGRERTTSPKKYVPGRLGASLLNAGAAAGRYVLPARPDSPASSTPVAAPSVSFAPSADGGGGAADEPAGEPTRDRSRGRSRMPSRSALTRGKSCVRGTSVESEAQIGRAHV